MQAEIGENLGPEAELAERRFGGSGRPLSPLGMRAKLGREVAPARQIDAHTATRALDREERLAQVFAPLGLGRAENVGEHRAAVHAGEDRLGAGQVALHERQELAAFGGTS